MELLCVDTHCGGSPSRVVVGGLPPIPGKSMFEKKQYLEQKADHFRQFLVYEPRGSPIMMGTILFPPSDPAAAFGYVIFEQTEYPPMSGHNTVCLATALLETGRVPMQEPITEFKLESPAGLVSIRAACENGKVTSVTVENAPSFVTHLGATLKVPTIGEISVDIAYGGMFYVIAEAADVGVNLTAEHGRHVARVGRLLTQCASEQLSVVHPLNPDIRGVTISQISAPPSPRNPCQKFGLKNACIISNGTFDWDNPDTWTGVIDRAATGTGTCARMATLYARKRLPLQTPFPHESIIESLMIGKVEKTIKVGQLDGIVPSFSASAFITGFNRLVLDPADPFPRGFTVSDIWGGKPVA